jgi:hypothetical protein
MITLEFKDTSGTVANIAVDCTLTEGHGFEVDPTQHPVETGSNITDHFRIKPKELHLEGAFADEPVIGGGLQVGRAADLYNQMQQLTEAGALVSISTELRRYENMLIRKLVSTKAKDTKGTVRWTADLLEIRLVSTQSVALSRTVRGGKKSKGPKTGKPAEEATKNQSQLKKLSNKAKSGAFGNLVKVVAGG